MTSYGSVCTENRCKILIDYTRAHTAKTTREALEGADIKLLLWSANSPNLIPSNTCGIY